MAYQIFKRRWWKEDPRRPGCLIPHLGRKTILTYVSTYEEAQTFCQDYNAKNKPGRYSLKAEFTSNY